MELRVLKYFLMIAREQNITRAAQLLHITQPTLSRQIKELEDELGIKLFERGNHSITLTQDGLLLRRRAQEIIELAERTRRDFAHKDEELSGEIAIGSGETLSVSTFAKMLASFHEAHPQVRYHLYSGNADHIKEHIENGTLDIGLLSEPVDISRYEFVRLPLREEWGVLTREDSPLGRLDVIRPQDLIGRPLMISARELMRNELTNWFGDVAEQADILPTTFCTTRRSWSKTVWETRFASAWTAPTPDCALFPCRLGWALALYWCGRKIKFHLTQYQNSLRILKNARKAFLTI